MQDMVEGLMLQLGRLPMLHGRAHGRNRYERVGTVTSKLVEIAKVDEEDDCLYEAYRSMPGMTDAQKHAELSDCLRSGSPTALWSALSITSTDSTGCPDGTGI
jgi:hypothetical protein